MEWFEYCANGERLDVHGLFNLDVFYYRGQYIIVAGNDSFHCGSDVTLEGAKRKAIEWAREKILNALDQMDRLSKGLPTIA